MENASVFTLHGCRGSMAAAGGRVRRYGGATTCFSLAGPRGMLIIDAGTGLINLGRRLARRRRLPPMTVLLTHLHLDHLVGLPLFEPLYRRDARIAFLADARRHPDWIARLEALNGPPYWPVPLRRRGAAVRFEPLPESRTRLRRHGFDIAWHPVRHPQGCLAFRLDDGRRSWVIATDHEADADGEALAGFCRSTDVLIADAQWTPAEYPARRGWGHGTWEACVRLAQAAGARSLVLTHHDWSRTDRQIDRIVRLARKRFPAVRAARDGLQV